MGRIKWQVCQDDVCELWWEEEVNEEGRLRMSIGGVVVVGRRCRCAARNWTNRRR